MLSVHWITIQDSLGEPFAVRIQCKKFEQFLYRKENIGHIIISASQCNSFELSTASWLTALCLVCPRMDKKGRIDKPYDGMAALVVERRSIRRIGGAHIRGSTEAWMCGCASEQALSALGHERMPGVMFVV